MHLLINKKIFIYIFLLILLGTLNNKNLYNFQFPKINKINVIGLDKDENLKLIDSLDLLKSKNLFTIDKFEIEKILNSNNLIEQHSIIKKYPSSIEIKINRAEFLARVLKNGKTFYLGSNGKLIFSKKEIKELPFIFGDFNKKDFFDLIKIINDSKFNFHQIKNLFYFGSGRWDIEIYSGVLIKLPRNKLKEAFDLSLKILDDDHFNQIKIIDTRQNNQVIIDG